MWVEGTNNFLYAAAKVSLQFTWEKGYTISPAVTYMDSMEIDLPSGNLYGFNGNRDGYVNFFMNVTWICNTGVSDFTDGFQLLQVNNT